MRFSANSFALGRLFSLRRISVASCWLTLCAGYPNAVEADVATGKRAAIATVHPLATQAGMDAFADGGNAMDAAVAAALMLGVVDNHNSGLGGGCFIVAHTADGALIAIDGRETAPAAAHRDMYLRDGKPQPELSQTGPLAVGTPGALAAYSMALKKYGTKSLGELLLPAADIAENGFAIDRVYARNLDQWHDALSQFSGTRAILLKPNGQPFVEGEVVKQRDLAKTYRNIATHGTRWFYNGPLAERVGDWMSAQGGALTQDDFASYRAISREPIVTTYRGHTIVGMPPPSSGGVHVAQILNILEQFDLHEIYQRDRGQFTHVVAEAMKLAFADRAHWLGDADYAPVPRGLISKEYARQLAARIDRDCVADVAKHGLPPDYTSDIFANGNSNKHTTHIATADAEGNWVAITATVNTSFGSKVIVPGTGLVLNNEMDDFSIAPGVPNAFGLVGAEANAVEPGKRPLSSMSPTIVLNNGNPILNVGAAGGPKIITQVVLAIIRKIDLQMPVEDAITAPRFHHQWRPDVLGFEATFHEAIIVDASRRMHTTAELPSAGVMQSIFRRDDGMFVAVSDPRVPSAADAE